MLKWIDLLKLFKYNSINILYLEFLRVYERNNL